MRIPHTRHVIDARGPTEMMACLVTAALAQPFFPHYPHRDVATLDGAWSFGFDATFGDALKPVDTAAVATPQTVATSQLVPILDKFAGEGCPARKCYFRAVTDINQHRRNFF